MGNTRGCEEHREKRKAAYNIYKHALRNNNLVRAERCENCLERGEIDGHHIDYSKPLEVVWLCKLCHAKIHHVNQFTDDNDFKKRTFKDLPPEKKEPLYKKLGINQFRRIPIEERCTQEERKQLEEYKKLWNHFMIEHFRAKDNAIFYFEKTQLLEKELTEKYTVDVEQIY